MARGPKISRRKSPYSRRVRAVKRTRKPVLSARAKAYVKPAPKLAAGKRKRVSTVSAAKRARPGSSSLKKVVLQNAKALRTIKSAAWGKYQTHNSVLGGQSPTEPNGGQSFTVSNGLPVCLHMNNLHSVAEKGAPHMLQRKTQTASGNDIEMSDTGITPEFTSVGQFKSNGVLQKSVYDRSTGVNSTPTNTPYPNGEKIKWHGTDMTFEVSGYCRNTTIDFWIVQEKKQYKAYDPWNSKTDYSLEKARHMPYTLQEFAHVSERMTPHKIDTKKYSVLGHKRCFVNNMNDSGSDSVIQTTIKNVTGERHLGAGTGGTLTQGVPVAATTKPKQYVHIKYCPHRGVYPLKRAIGEAVNADEKVAQIKPNPYEVRSIGQMAWDNFDPKANIWLVITTDHVQAVARDQILNTAPQGQPSNGESDEAYLQYMNALEELQPNIKCLRKCWWQDEHTPSAVMGQFPAGSGHRHLSQVVTTAQWEANLANLATMDDLIEANPSAPAAQPPPGAMFNANNPGGDWYVQREHLREFFHRFPTKDAMGVLP